jgi:Sulfotransferase domain
VRANESEHRLIALWSAPRCRSTAFFRMFVERGDFTAIHEPFSSRAEHGHAELAGRRLHTEIQLIEALRDLAGVRPVFFKDTTDDRYPAVLDDEAFLRDDVRHTFLIRHPYETIPSYYAINPRVSLEQIGFRYLYELFTAVRELTKRVPVVVDSAALIQSPQATVGAYCRALSIPHVAGALSWAPEDRAEWQATAKWHADVSRSTGFRDKPPAHDVTWSDIPQLEAYLRYHRPYYELLHAHRLRP